MPFFMYMSFNAEKVDLFSCPDRDAWNFILTRSKGLHIAAPVPPLIKAAENFTKGLDVTLLLMLILSRRLKKYYYLPVSAK